MSKAKFELKGFEELVKSLSELDTRLQNQISKEAIEEASIIMHESLKSEAPRAKTNSQSSYAFLDRTVVRKGSSHQAKMGINKYNWDVTRGLTLAPLYSDI